MYSAKFIIILLFVLCFAKTHAGTLPYPTLIKPNNNDRTCRVGSDVSFGWSPVQGATSYTLQIFSCQRESCADPNNWSDITPGSPVNVGAKVSHKAKLPKRGQYWWRVWANQGSSQGRKSDWFKVECQ